jgi:hypothetical protein
MKKPKTTESVEIIIVDGKTIWDFKNLFTDEDLEELREMARQAEEDQKKPYDRILGPINFSWE